MLGILSRGGEIMWSVSETGVIYSGRKAQEHGTGRTNFTLPQCLVMMRTQIFL